MARLNLALRCWLAFLFGFGPVGLTAAAFEGDSAYWAWARSRSAMAFAAVSLREDPFRAFAREPELSIWAAAVPSLRLGYRAFAGGMAARPVVSILSLEGYAAYSGYRALARDAAAHSGLALRYVPAAALSGRADGFRATAVDSGLVASSDGLAAVSTTSIERVARRRGAPAESMDAPPPEPVYAPPSALGGNDDTIAIPDRWRIVETLKVKKENLMDPYNQNTLKGDRPIYGKDWFLNLNVISDSMAEFRRLPTPVGNQADLGPRTDAFGAGEQATLSQNLITSIALIKGNTTFRPPDYEFRFTGVTNLNYNRAKVAALLNNDPSDHQNGQNDRLDNYFGVQEFFIDKHLDNKSDRYDFDSLRVGVQPFISDFRGFIFQDQEPGVRLFGNFVNNRIQYNLAYFRRFDKDTNSGLNTFSLRKDDVYAANLFYQDFPVLGFQLQGTVIHNRNREGTDPVRFDTNGFQIRPAAVGNQLRHNYQVTYFGVNGDGHFDRLNLTFASYYALGTDDRNQIADRKVDIGALFGAAEASVDFDYFRVKAYALYSQGDANPFDSKATGFDSIFENPQFGGGDTSFFQRQAIPLIGGGRVVLHGRNALIPDLRSSKEQGQSNFVNPGLRMVGVGADFDILPELRLITNASYLDFDATAPLRALRTQGPIPRHIGEDLSAAIVYRPLFINNVLLRLSAAMLIPGDGFDALFDRNHKNFQYSTSANIILTY
jgi:hypothetical protein